MTVSPDPTTRGSAARNRRASLRLDFAFGAFWIVTAVAALLMPPQDLWPSLLCVGWAALGGYIVGQTMQEWREEREQEAQARGGGGVPGV
jgi:hypothetical protein